MVKRMSVFAKDASKAYFECISLIWAPLSLIALLLGVLGTGLHNYCDRYSYLLISIALCLPGFVIPVLYPCAEDVDRPYRERFWVKAAVWIGIFSFYGNYFWTHYFYHLLGARYLFDAHRFNDVPIVCFLCTFFYFTFYFAFVNVVLRALRRASDTHLPASLRPFAWYGGIAALAYGTAIFEALSIQHFPLYAYTDRHRFLTVGSMFYALYFIIGFPMFFSIDEAPLPPSRRASLRDVAINALAATAIVTLLLDLWRVYLGNIYTLGRSAPPVPLIYRGEKHSLGVIQRLRDQLTLLSLRVRFFSTCIIRRLRLASDLFIADYIALRNNLARRLVALRRVRDAQAAQPAARERAALLALL